MYTDFLATCRIRLPRDEEARLFRAMRRGDESARQRLIESQLPYVVAIAKPFVRPHLPLADLCQVGVLGLLECLPKFRPSQGRLSTFCKRPVYWRIHTHCKRQRSLLSRPANRPINPDLVPAWERALDVGYFGEGQAELVPAPDDPPDRRLLEGDEQTQREALHAAIARLPPRMRDILRRRLAGELLRTIGADWDLSRERVRQIEESAIARLQKWLA